MSLRVITGRAKGRRIQVLDHPQVRPTTDRVRQVLFDILGGECLDAIVLDLYAGSGALGIEAWSRGAREVTFVEQLPEAARLIRSNLESVGATGKVFTSRVEDHLAMPGHTPADLVFLDPPYERGLGSIQGVLGALASSGAVREAGIVVVESPGPIIWPPPLRGYRERRVGGTTISFAKTDGNDRDLPGDL